MSFASEIRLQVQRPNYKLLVWPILFWSLACTIAVTTHKFGFMEENSLALNELQKLVQEYFNIATFCLDIVLTLMLIGIVALISYNDLLSIEWLVGQAREEFARLNINIGVFGAALSVFLFSAMHSIVSKNLYVSFYSYFFIVFFGLIVSSAKEKRAFNRYVLTSKAFEQKLAQMYNGETLQITQTLLDSAYPANDPNSIKAIESIIVRRGLKHSVVNNVWLISR